MRSAALKIDTVITFNPWGHGEENPDHYVTGQAVEAAKWMAGGVSRHDIAAIWLAFFSRWRRYRG